MAPTILIVGSTGNTGQHVIHSLPKLLEQSKTLSGYRILGVTRSLNNPTAQKLAKLPQVEMIEKDWTEINADWLREHEVVRVYIAPHNQPDQFVAESAFYVASLQAAVKYVVKLSTFTKTVSPTTPVYYGRSHWAIENMLSQPEFKNLQWTSLQPNIFTVSALDVTAKWIQQYRKSGKQEPFKTLLAEDEHVAMIDPTDVGTVGACLLALDDPSPHNQAKYVLNGPEDLNGKMLVEIVEKEVGIKIENVKFKDISFLEDFAFPENLLSLMKIGFNHYWCGEGSLAQNPTSKEVIEIAAPKCTPAVALKAMLEHSK